MTDLIAADSFDRLPERYRRRAREIARRVSEIDAFLASASSEQIGEELKRMRRQLRPQPDTEPADMAQGFKDACRDLPAWVVSEAANDFLAGRVANHTGQYMPTCAEFAKRAREAMTPFLAERAALRIEAGKLIERASDEARRDAIAIERQDPQVKARVAAMLADAKMSAPDPIRYSHGALTPEKQARLDAMKRHKSPPSKIAESRMVRSASNGK